MSWSLAYLTPFWVHFLIKSPYYSFWSPLEAQLVKSPPANAGDPGSIPRLSPGEGKGYPLQYSGLENSMDCIVHGVAECQTWLNNVHFTAHFIILFPLSISLNVYNFYCKRKFNIIYIYNYFLPEEMDRNSTCPLC